MATKQGISIFNEKLSVQLNADVFDKATDNTVSIKTGEGIKVTSDKGLILDETVVTNIAATEVAKIVDGAPDAYDTLKDIADYIKGDITGAANMQNAINANAEAIKTKQDKLGTGSGIVITEDNVITVDGSQLTVKLATNAINATNDANGKSITGTYATRNELNGVNETIDAVNNTVKSHTTSIETLINDKQDKLEFGNGLSTVGNLVKVDTTVLQDIADNKKNIGTLSSSIDGKQDALTFGSGLSFASNTKTLSVSDSVMTQVSTNKGDITTLKSTTTGHNTRISALESSTQKTLTPENGVYIDASNKIGVKHDDTLKVSNGSIGVHIGTGLKTSENSAIVVKMGDGITNDSDLAIKVNHDDTLAITSDGKLQVKESAIANIAAAKVSEIVANAPTDYDTLKEIADYISSDKTNAAAMSNDIATVKGWGNHGIAGYAKKVKIGNTTYEADPNAVVRLPAYPTSLPANGGNADTLGGYLPRNVDISFTQAREKELDLTALDSNYYYPCSIYLTHVSPAQIRIWCSLGDRPIPSWATHSDGFVLNLEWEAVGCGWGITSVQRKITTYHYAFSDKSPCGDITQNTMPSEEIVFLRGGAKYFYHTSNGGYFVVHPNGYSWSSGDRSVNHPIRPLSEAVVLWSCSDNSALGIGAIVTNYVYGTAARADKLSTPRKIWGQDFDGSGDVSGTLKLYSHNNYHSHLLGDTTGMTLETWQEGVGYLPLKLQLNGGNVGIGTDDPQYKLDVKGDVRVSANIGFGGTLNSNNHYLFVRDDDKANWVVTNKSWTKEYNLLHTGNLTTYFTDGFEHINNNIVRISTSYITEKIKGDGLVLDESGKMSVDSANLSVKNADTLDGHDSSYFATKNELGNKQNTLAFGSGIAHSNNTIWVDGSRLNVNYANSAGSVAWGNVSGRPSFGSGFDSTNNVVQLKLSTGLAIDSQGYLYVVPSQIANTE